MSEEAPPTELPDLLNQAVARELQVSCGMTPDADRKELIRTYKETPRPAGVYRVRNTVNGRSLVGSSSNLPGMLNRQRFQLEHGSHPCRELQKHWQESGPDAFSFEILDQLEPSSDAGYDPSADLLVLKQMWLEKLTEQGEPLYD